MSISDKARVFATAAHTAVKQVRKYSGDPYIVHPKEVAELTSAFMGRESRKVGEAEIWEATAWLHDTREDCNIPREMIFDEFGPVIDLYVNGLTDVSKLSDGNRKVRKLMDLAHTAAQGYEVQTIKCFDIRANARSIEQSEDAFKYTWRDEKKQLIQVMTRADPIALELLTQPIEWTHNQDLEWLRSYNNG